MNIIHWGSIVPIWDMNLFPATKLSQFYHLREVVELRIVYRFPCLWLFTTVQGQTKIKLTLSFELTDAEMGVAFQHCNFFFNFSKNIFGKKLKKTFFHLFYSNFFNIISEKKVNIFYKFGSVQNGSGRKLVV